MRLMTADDLVQAVTELSRGSDLPVPAAPKIFDWCKAFEIDTHGPRGNHRAFQDASNQEARGQHRLLKFRRVTAGNPGVGFALVVNGDRVRPRASAEGWCELPWNGRAW
jgi:hypothetical protein